MLFYLTWRWLSSHLLCHLHKVLLDGVPLLDLPGMLKYVTTTHSSTSTISSDGTTADPSSAGAVAAGVGAALGGHSNGTGTGTGNKVPLTRLDQEDSPAKSLLQRISNVHLRNVRRLSLFVSASSV